MRLPSARFLRFCAIGGTSALLSLGLLALLTRVAHLDYLLAFALTFVVMNVLSYAAARRFAFGATTVGRGTGLARYLVVACIGLAINLAMMRGLVGGLGIGPLVAACIVAVLNAPLNYLMHRGLTFGLSGRRP